MAILNPILTVLLLAYLLTSLLTGSWLAPIPALLIGLALLTLPLIVWMSFLSLVFILALIIIPLYSMIVAPLLRVIKRPSIAENATGFDSTSHSEEWNLQSESDSTFFDPYNILGVSPKASYEQVKTSYKKQMQAYHPDKVAHLGEALQDLANKRTKDIQRAYEELALTRS